MNPSKHLSYGARLAGERRRGKPKEIEAGMAIFNIVLGAYAAWRTLDLKAKGKPRWSWISMGTASAGLFLSGVYRLVS